MFNSDQVKSFVRSVVIAVGGYFVGKGWLDQEMVVQIAGGVGAFAAAIWGIWFHSGATKVDMATVVLDEADSATEAKVVDASVKLVA